MTSRALVLGGGGPVGVAWETGLVAGLDAQGVSLAQADLFVGTSAGSIVGSQLALTRPPREMFEAQLTVNERSASARRPFRSPEDFAAVIQHFVKLYTSEAPIQELRAEMGSFALEADTGSEEEWLASFGSFESIRAAGWPERAFACTAVDTADGSLVLFDRASGVDLAGAVAASCAVPGLVPPVTINGRRYMDGGVGSTTNAQFARGYDRVLVVPVIGGSTGGGRAGAIQQRFAEEIDDLRRHGSAVEVVVPDDAAREAFGPNLLDSARRPQIAEAGLAQGRAEAERVGAFWR